MVSEEKPKCPYPDLDRQLVWNEGYAAALRFSLSSFQKLIETRQFSPEQEKE